MELHIHIHHHADQRVVDKLDLLLAGQEIIMDNVDRLIDDVAKQNTTIESMKTFISGLKSQVADALAGAKLSAEHEAKLAAIFPSLEANTDAITAAITTAPVPPPADPVPTPTPAPDPVPVATDPTIPSGTVTPDPTAPTIL